jgi:hypothetical protein
LDLAIEKGHTKTAALLESAASAGEFVEGQKVEARMGGEKKFYAGKITKDNGNGTYEVHYDDDDRRRRAARFIRVPYM